MNKKAPALSVTDKALKILAYSPVSEAELRRKLLRAGYPDLLIEPVIVQCRQRGYLNDELLASDSVQLMRQRGIGRRMIQVKLRRRGIDRELVNGAIEAESETSELDAGRLALESKLRLLTRETELAKRKEKAYRYMASRGFPAAVTIKLFEQVDWQNCCLKSDMDDC